MISHRERTKMGKIVPNREVPKKTGMKMRKKRMRKWMMKRKRREMRMRKMKRRERKIERKERDIVELKDTGDRSKLEAVTIMAELKEKNTESESICPNLVSKETFIRTQFKKLQKDNQDLKESREGQAAKEAPGAGSGVPEGAPKKEEPGPGDGSHRAATPEGVR